MNVRLFIRIMVTATVLGVLLVTGFVVADVINNDDHSRVGTVAPAGAESPRMPLREQRIVELNGELFDTGCDEWGNRIYYKHVTQSVAIAVVPSDVNNGCQR